jgi:hypothetical protein
MKEKTSADGLYIEESWFDGVHQESDNTLAVGEGGRRQARDMQDVNGKPNSFCRAGPDDMAARRDVPHPMRLCTG